MINSWLGAQPWSLPLDPSVGRTLTFSIDGNRLYAVDDQVRSWDVTTGEPWQTGYRLPPEVVSLTNRSGVIVAHLVVWQGLCRDGGATSTHVIRTSLCGEVQTRLVLPGQVLCPFETNACRMSSPVISPNGQFLATLIDRGRAVAVYDLNASVQRYEIPCSTSLIRQVALCQESNMVFLRQGNRLSRHSLQTGDKQDTMPDDGLCTDLIARSPGGRWLVTGIARPSQYDSSAKESQRATEKSLWLRNPDTGQRVARLELDGIPREFLFLDEESILVTVMNVEPNARPHYSLSLWDLANASRIWHRPAKHGIRLLPVPQRPNLFATTDGSCVQLYNALTGDSLAWPTLGTAREANRAGKAS